MKEVENKDFFDTMMETMMERVQKTKYKVGYVCEIWKTTSKNLILNSTFISHDLL